MSATYEEMKDHVDHDMKLFKDDVGDIILYCDDCNMELDSWEKSFELTWHGTIQQNETGNVTIEAVRND